MDDAGHASLRVRAARRRRWTMAALVAMAAGCGRDPLLPPNRDAAPGSGGMGGLGGQTGDALVGAGGSTSDAAPEARPEAGTDIRPGTVTLTLQPAVAAPLPVGQTLQWRAFVLVGTTPRDVTQEPELTWSTDDASVASVTERGGRVLAVAIGRTEIRARHPLLGMASTSVLVTAATVTGVAIDPATLQLPIGDSRPLAAKATYSDGSESDVTFSAQWSSGDQRIARVGTGVERPGLTTATGAGETLVTAAFAGAAGRASVSVAGVMGELMLNISPAMAARPLNMTARFQAIARLPSGAITDVTNQATWTSSNSNVAAPLGAGQFRCNAGATVMVSARFMQVSASALLECGEGMVGVRELRLSQVNSSLFVGMRYRLEVEAVLADGTTMRITNPSQVTWHSSDQSIATIDAGGVISGLRPGTVTVTARFGGAMGQESYTFVAR